MSTSICITKKKASMQAMKDYLKADKRLRKDHAVFSVAKRKLGACQRRNPGGSCTAELNAYLSASTSYSAGKKLANIYHKIYVVALVKYNKCMNKHKNQP